MTLHRQLKIWAIALAVLVFSLWLFSDILLPFIAGIVLAYFLDPLADTLERIGMPRLSATLFILTASLLALVLIVILLVPALTDQIAGFVERLPTLITTLAGYVDSVAPGWLKAALARSEISLGTNAGDIAGKAATILAALVTSLWSGGLALVNIISLLLVTPVVAFYMLYDWDRMVATVDGWVPVEHKETVRVLAREMDETLAGFIRGAGTVCLVLGTFYAVGLIAVGLNFGLLIGLAAGFLSFIPFIGAITGGVLAIATALFQFWPDWFWIVTVGAIFGLGQFLEGNILTPRLVGNRVGVHPVWLMFALFAFGYLFGFVGVLLAVPLAAAIGVVMRFALRQYLASPLYLGQPDAVPQPALPSAAEPPALPPPPPRSLAAPPNAPSPPRRKRGQKP